MAVSAAIVCPATSVSDVKTKACICGSSGNYVASQSFFFLFFFSVFYSSLVKKTNTVVLPRGAKFETKFVLLLCVDLTKQLHEHRR